ncbi:hypothetical protein ASPTUDRAFT_545924 [Aspergillus tubingensis CBS 134.48]|uniref:Uncharacterized protein n=1 Tax=Aspergillus tubingensis (strain CBS 134.48) TaxID=767770 RepID=A0A1L9N6L8_ASPTC|nr:hypothetical protein ASPTUDRAFT_545924 [Aspergillus tubingensis CBS 134.48]
MTRLPARHSKQMETKRCLLSIPSMVGRSVEFHSRLRGRLFAITLGADDPPPGSRPTQHPTRFPSVIVPSVAQVMMYDFHALRSKDMLDWSPEVVPTYRTALFLSHFVIPSSTMSPFRCRCVCPGKEKKRRIPLGRNRRNLLDRGIISPRIRSGSAHEVFQWARARTIYA